MEYAKQHPQAKASLQAWYAVTKTAHWNSIAEVRKTFPHADAINVKSGKTVTIFNISGNHHRLVSAIHYNTGKLFILQILTHSQYDKSNWKEEL
jgi:mRNA interferase HigB